MVGVQGGSPHQLSGADRWVTAGPDVTTTAGAGHRVAWIERAEIAMGTADQPIVGGPAPVAWTVYAEVLP